jgi:hypothetical protein
MDFGSKLSRLPLINGDKPAMTINARHSVIGVKGSISGRGCWDGQGDGKGLGHGMGSSVLIQDRGFGIGEGASRHSNQWYKCAWAILEPSPNMRVSHGDDNPYKE